MYISILLLLLNVGLVWDTTPAESTVYHQVKALPGDGIYSVLRRYELDQHSCNFTKFYTLNKLKRNAQLRVGRTYKLPILIYNFNGRTIRSSIGINDWDLAVRIQRYNERMAENLLRADSYKESRKLWVPFHELNCPSSDMDVPPPVDDNPEEVVSTGNRKFPIFGDKYAYTPLRSNKLKGKVYYVVSGHGGPDPGAMGKRGAYTLCEDEYAYDVALRLCRHLVAHGATAYMVNRDPDDGIREEKFLICDYDEVLWGDIKMMRQQKARLFQRSNAVNELYQKHKLQGVNDQRMIIIHVDSRSRGERTDLYFYHQAENQESKKLAQALYRSMKRNYRKYQANRGYNGKVSSRDLHMLRESLPSTVYIELANIRNTFDQQRIVIPKNRQYLADWLFEGLLE
ncbi:MAG: N-acetylmuramoyl-L-alanine amidase [Saprospiraceae bacterium]|nr:N-acetylmuramoyl-L-alanine amidase [Saprospiraceae bacterium]